MTTTASRLETKPETRPAGQVSRPGRTRKAPRVFKPPKPRRVAPAGVRVIATAITLFSLSLLGFSGYLAFGARLHHDRAQLVAWANFRKDLADATAPTSQTKPDNPKQLLDLGTPVALLEIPKLHLKEVVFEGTTASVLEMGPGHLRSTVLPGQAGVSEIMGRAALYGGPFGQLSTLEPGDAINVTTGRGVHNYKVIDVRLSGMPQPPPMAVGAGRLLLATAYGGPIVPTDVLRVDADLTSPVQPTRPLVIAGSKVSPAEKPMAIDRRAWLWVIAWEWPLVIAVVLVSLARVYWGRWQAWIIAVPIVSFLGFATADVAARLLPNLM
ncbi:MAG: sortase [Micromonosporaceae bacterium]|nr:sortase [Micromonosporaceae bacterium]